MTRSSDDDKMRSAKIYLLSAGLIVLTSCSDGGASTAPSQQNAGSVPNMPPVAMVSADPLSGEAPLTVTFSGTASTDMDGTISSYSWDFNGDGVADAQGEAVSHAYTEAGSFNAVLTVTDDDGASSSQTIGITASSPIPNQTAGCSDSLNGRSERLGVNLYETFEDGSNVFFNDLFREAQLFVPMDANNLAEFDNEAVTLSVDSNGYPTNIGELQTGPSGELLTVAAQSVVYDDAIYLPGDYTLAWEGEGVFTLDAGSRITIEDIDEPGRNNEPDNTRIVTVPNDLAELIVVLTILESEADNPLRNFRLWVPGTAPDAPSADFAWPINNLFTEQTLRNIEPFSLIRFMDWNRTNFAPHPPSFADRSVASRYTWSGSDEVPLGSGVPYEAMVQLANETCSDIWINIPHMVDSDYPRQLARLIDGQISPGLALDPALKVYIEFSNEAWNGQFPVRQALIDEAQAIIASGDIGDIDPSDFGPSRVYARRSADVFRAFNEVLGEDRVVSVLAGQAGFAFVLESATDELQRRGDLGLVDVLAIAPYLPAGPDVSVAVAEVRQILGDPPGNGAELSEAQVAAVLDLHLQDVDETFRIGALEDGGREHFLNRDLANRLGLPLITYEGGQHLIGEDGENIMFFADIPRINRNEGMGDVIAAYLPAWFEFSGGVNTTADPDLTTLTLYHASGFWNQNEAFGLLEYDRQDPSTSPKYQAVLDFLAAEE